MATLDSLVWNCGGLTNTSSSHKAMFFEKNFGATFDIAVLLETHHKDKAALPQELLRYEKSYDIVHSPAPENEPYSGIICLISHKYKVCEENHLIPGRCLNIKLENISDKTNFNLTAIYLYTNNNLNPTRAENFVNLLKTTVEKDSNKIIESFQTPQTHKNQNKSKT